MKEIKTSNGQVALAWSWRDSYICIVLSKVNDNKQKAYIKTIYPEMEEEKGVRLTMERGVKLTFQEAKGFFKELVKKDKYIA